MHWGTLGHHLPNTRAYADQNSGMHLVFVSLCVTAAPLPHPDQNRIVSPRDAIPIEPWRKKQYSSASLFKDPITDSLLRLALEAYHPDQIP